MLVAQDLQGLALGAFSAMVAAAVITMFNDVLISSAALYSVDFLEQFIGDAKDQWKLTAASSTLLTILAVIIVPSYQRAESIIYPLAQFNTLLSLPILSAFVNGLLFWEVAALAAICGVNWTVKLQGIYAFQPETPVFLQLPHVDFVVVTFAPSMFASLTINRLMGDWAKLVGIHTVVA